MYDSLVENYRVIFEGAFAPVFYRRFYPTFVDGDNSEHKGYLQYAWGLKSDCGSYDTNYASYAQEYERDLRDLLGCFVGDTKGLRRGVVVIPSSTKGRVNRVTELARRVVGSGYASAISDLTRYFRRTQSKEESHSGGTRSTTENMDTLLVDPRGRIQDYGAILVLDDITTSGNSFLSADAKLREAGFEGVIVNFAFARTCPSEGVDLFMRWEARNRAPSRTSVAHLASSSDAAVGYRVSLPDGSVRDFEGGFSVVKKARHMKRTLTSGARAVKLDSRVSVRFGDGQVAEFDNPDDFKARVKRITRLREVEGIVFDLDDTLVRDTPRDLAYEERLCTRGGGAGQEHTAVPCPYRPFPGVRDFMSLGIPFAVVSNRPPWEIERLVGDPVINDSIYPGRMAKEKQVLEEWRSSGERFYPLELLRGTGTEQNQRENLFSYPSRRVDGYEKPVRLYKPCPEGVVQAIGHVRSAGRLGPDARIVGVGNTLEDMIAYRAAGIESVLALWGVPEYLRGHAERHWGADHCFGSMAELGRWCGRDVPGTGESGTDGAHAIEDRHGSTTSEQRASHWRQDSEPSMSSGQPGKLGGYFNEGLLPEGVIHWSETGSHIGEMVSVYGEVVSTFFDWEDYERNIAAYQMGADPGPTFIEIGERYPSKKLVKVVIWGRDRWKFGEAPDAHFKDKTVVFTGRPYVYNGVTTVQITDPESIHVVNPIANLYRTTGPSTI